MIVGVLCAIAGFYFLADGVYRHYWLYESIERTGTWIGGTAGSLFSMAAFIVILGQLVAQQKELTELKLNAEEQRELQARQILESTILQLIAQLNTSLESLKVTERRQDGSKVTAKSWAAIQLIGDHLERQRNDFETFEEALDPHTRFETYVSIVHGYRADLEIYGLEYCIKVVQAMYMHIDAFLYSFPGGDAAPIEASMNAFIDRDFQTVLLVKAFGANIFQRQEYAPLRKRLRVLFVQRFKFDPGVD